MGQEKGLVHVLQEHGRGGRLVQVYSFIKALKIVFELCLRPGSQTVALLPG